MKKLIIGLRVLFVLLNPFKKIQSDNVADDWKTGETTNFGNLTKK